MSQKNKVVSKIDPAKETVEEAIKYDVAALRQGSFEVFGVTTSTFDGAFYDVDTSKQYSIDEARSIITKWLNKEVK